MNAPAGQFRAQREISSCSASARGQGSGVKTPTYTFHAFIIARKLPGTPARTRNIYRNQMQHSPEVRYFSLPQYRPAIRFSIKKTSPYIFRSSGKSFCIHIVFSCLLRVHGAELGGRHALQALEVIAEIAAVFNAHALPNLGDAHFRAHKVALGDLDAAL